MDESRQGETLLLKQDAPGSRKLFLESYGCAMNFSDSEIVASILSGRGFSTTSDYRQADVILVNTCAIRENAESRVRQRLHDFKKEKRNNPGLIIGVLGCMAERLKSSLLEEEKLVDIVVGPDAYRDLPSLIEKVEGGQRAVNVLLSREETYADISPVRLDSNGVTAFISITRGCDNMCSFCVVPFTRGRERSRDPESIVREAEDLFSRGYREVTLLGQNVDSYHFSSPDGNKTGFAELLAMTAGVNSALRVRFSTSHPKDMSDEVLHAIASHENICNYVHLPVQSGSSRILEMMNRGYTREWYMSRIEAIRRIIPGCGISTDTISGFCTETEDDHRQTLSLIEWAQFDFAYMFKYSERPGTLAERKYKDDVPEEIKSERLAEIIDLQQKMSAKKTAGGVGNVHRVLVEGVSKKSDSFLYGRNPQNTVVVFPRGNFRKGDYVNVLAGSCTPATLKGSAV